MESVHNSHIVIEDIQEKRKMMKMETLNSFHFT